MMNAINRQLMLLALAFLSLLSAVAQEKADSILCFRFLPGNDMFLLLCGDNGKELERLFGSIEQYREKIQEGETPLYVDGYCNSGDTKKACFSLAKTRSNRVKSELITRKGLTEDCFITRNHAEKGDFVTVCIIVPKADINSMTQEQPEEKKETVVPSMKEGKDETVRQEEPLVIEETPIQKPQPIQTEEPLVIKDKETYTLALRANLLRWVTLTPDLGIEWRISPSWSVLANGSWTSWTWNGKDRRYALWEVSPEVRYYIGKEKRGYVGAMFKAGRFNYKLSATGKQGDLMGGGITGGYQLRLNNAFSLDFNFGIGCVRADYEKYEVISGARVRQGKEKKNWWGPFSAGITLVWNIF